MISSISLKQAHKKIVPLALTMAGTQLINVASGFLCIMMLASLGEKILAASALMISTQISIMVIAMSLLFPLSILIGHAYGGKKYREIGNYMQHGWLLALILSIPVMILFWFMSSLLDLFGQPKQILPLIKNFFHAYIWAVVPTLFSICNQQLCNGIRKQKLVIFTSLLSVTVLLLTAYLLILGKCGLPRLGTAGLGYAMAAQTWFSAIFLLVILNYNQVFKEFDLFSFRIHKSWEHLRQMFKIGWPISVQMSAEMVSFFVISILVGWIGTEALAAGQIVNQFLFLLIVPVFAISQASGIVVGQAYGAKQLYEIKSLGYASLQLALMIAFLCALVFWLLPTFLTSFYLNVNDPVNADTVSLTKRLFMICAFMQIFDAARNVLTGGLRGLFDTRFPMMIGIGALWGIGLPCSYIFGFILKGGLVGIVLGSTLGVFIGALIILARWKKLTSFKSLIPSSVSKD